MNGFDIENIPRHQDDNEIENAAHRSSVKGALHSARNTPARRALGNLTNSGAFSNKPFKAPANLNPTTAAKDSFKAPRRALSTNTQVYNGSKTFGARLLPSYKETKSVAGLKVADDVARAQKITEYSRDGIEHPFGLTYEEINSAMETKSEMEIKRKMENIFTPLNPYQDEIEDPEPVVIFSSDAEAPLALEDCNTEDDLIVLPGIEELETN